MNFNALTWIGLLIAVIGWLLLIFASAPGSADLAGLGVGRGRTPIINFHLVSIYTNIILSGFAIAVLGAIQEAVIQLRPSGRSAEYAKEILNILRKDAPAPMQTHSSKTISETPGQPVSRPAQPISVGEVQSHFDPEADADETAQYRGVDIYVLKDQTAIFKVGETWRKFDSVLDANMYINRLQRPGGTDAEAQRTAREWLEKHQR